MIALKPSPLPLAPGTSAPSAPLNLQARLSAATEALMKTREQVVEALDRHLNELDTLRRALGSSDRPLLSVVPAMAPAPQALPVEMPAPAAAPMMPLMTQVVWPAKGEAPGSAPLRPVPPVASFLNAPPPSSPLVAYPSMQEAAAREMVVDPELEKATLEELNAALAYAFNHVARGRSQG